LLHGFNRHGLFSQAMQVRLQRTGGRHGHHQAPKHDEGAEGRVARQHATDTADRDQHTESPDEPTLPCVGKVELEGSAIEVKAVSVHVWFLEHIYKKIGEDEFIARIVPIRFQWRGAKVLQGEVGCRLSAQNGW